MKSRRNVPLTADEKAKKINEIKDLHKANRMEREKIEKAEEIVRETSMYTLQMRSNTTLNWKIHTEQMRRDNRKEN